MSTRPQGARSRKTQRQDELQQQQQWEAHAKAFGPANPCRRQGHLTQQQCTAGGRQSICYYRRGSSGNCAIRPRANAFLRRYRAARSVEEIPPPPARKHRVDYRADRDEPDWAASLTHQELLGVCSALRVPVVSSSSRHELISACNYETRLSPASQRRLQSACKRVGPTRSTKREAGACPVVPSLLKAASKTPQAPQEQVPGPDEGEEIDEEEQDEDEEDPEEKDEDRRVLQLFGLQPLRWLGSGTYGSVWLVRWTTGSSKRVVAAKIIRPSAYDEESWGAPEAAVREASVYRQTAPYSHISRLLDVYYDLSRRFPGAVLLFEEAEHGDLSSALSKAWATASSSGHYSSFRGPLGPAPEALVRRLLRLAYSLICGLAQAHAEHLVVLDLKPNNVLVFSSDVAKVADLGGAYPERVLPEYWGDRSMSTLWYRSPDEQCGPPRTDDGRTARYLQPSRDMWTLGLVLLELFFRSRPTTDRYDVHGAEDLMAAWIALIGQPPCTWWAAQSGAGDRGCRLPTPCAEPPVSAQERRQAIERVLYPSAAAWSTFYGAPLYSQLLNLLGQLLNWDAAQRITAANALRHPAFRSLPVAERKRCAVQKSVARPVAEPDAALLGKLRQTLEPGLRDVFKDEPPAIVDTLLVLTATILTRYAQLKGLPTKSVGSRHRVVAALIIAIKALDIHIGDFVATIEDTMTAAQKADIVAQEAELLRTLHWDLDAAV